MIYYKYKIFCQTDNRYEYIIKASTEPTPTTCPVDTNHIVDINSVAIHETIDTSVKKTDVISTPAIASKTTADGKKLFKRVHGIRADVVVGTNTITWTIPYPHAKFLSIEFTEGLGAETAELNILDTATGTYSGVPNYKLNQFGFTTNIPKDFYAHKSEFDADLYQGMIIEVTFNAKATNNIGINFVLNEVKA